VAGFELAMAAQPITPLVDGAVTTTQGALTSLTTAGLGNTISQDVFVSTQVNAYLVRVDYQTTFVNNNGLYGGFSTMTQALTYGVGSPTVHGIHYFYQSPAVNNPVYWEFPADNTPRTDTYYEFVNKGTQIRLETAFNNGRTGTFIQTGIVFYSANALYENTRRAVLKNGILANVCAVG
jgi:hypothetical protein